MKWILFFATLLSGCSSMSSDGLSAEDYRDRFQAGVRPAPTQLHAGQDWRCVDCAAGTKRCNPKMHNVRLLQFDDIYVVAPPAPGEDTDARLVGHAFVFEGEEMYSHVYGNASTAYLRLDPKTLGIIFYNETTTISSYIYCEDPHPKTKPRAGT